MVDSQSELGEAYNRVVARYYDCVYGALPELDESRDFYLALAERTRRPVLELGCGTGRILLELARRQIPCVGLDSSRAMLDVLRQKHGAGELELVCSQMQGFDLGPRRFALVCAPFRAFQHLYDRNDQLGCLRRVIAHLERGGVFAFDVASPFAVRHAPLEESERLNSRFELDSVRISHYVSKRHDPASCVTVVTMRFEIQAPRATVWSEREIINMRWFEEAELRALMQEAGFVDISIFGDFDAGPATQSSPALVVTAKRP